MALAQASVAQDQHVLAHTPQGEGNAGPAHPCVHAAQAGQARCGMGIEIQPQRVQAPSQGQAAARAVMLHSGLGMVSLAGKHCGTPREGAHAHVGPSACRRPPAPLHPGTAASQCSRARKRGAPVAASCSSHGSTRGWSIRHRASLLLHRRAAHQGALVGASALRGALLAGSSPHHHKP